MLNLPLDELPAEVTEEVHKFRKFLVNAWSRVYDLLENHDWNDDPNFMQDWLQGNWEILMERELLDNTSCLTSYSVDPNRRISKIDCIPEYTIHALCEQKQFDVKTKIEIPFEKGLRFYRLVSCEENKLKLQPPFDHACLINDATKEIYVCPLTHLEFFLIEEKNKHE